MNDNIRRDERGRVLPSSHCLKGHPLEGDNLYFHTRSNGRTVRYCKQCRKERSAIADAARYKDFRQRVYNILKETPCVDCGETRIACLQFDHIDPSTKEFSISRAIPRMKDFSRIRAEIAKCEVRCANCHAVRTAKQFGWYQGLE